VFKNVFFRKSRRLWDNVENFSRTTQATYEHFMVDT